MKPTQVFSSHSGFEILQTTERSQSSVMILEAGEASSAQPNRHPESDQTLLVVEGTLAGEVAAAHLTLRTGDTLIVPANTPHRFVNPGQGRAVAFSVYAPPAYPPGHRE